MVKFFVFLLENKFVSLMGFVEYNLIINISEIHTNKWTGYFINKIKV